MQSHSLVTFPSALWVLQSLLGLEQMPPAIRQALFIAAGSAHIPVATYPEYQSLVGCGVIDERGQVHSAVADWLTVIAQPDLEVQVIIRRPGPTADTACEVVTVFCRLGCWICGISRAPADDTRRARVAADIGFTGDPQTLPAEWVDEIRVFPVAEVSGREGQKQALLEAVLAQLGRCEPAVFEGLNIEFTTFLQASGTAAGDAEMFTDLLMRQGVSARQIAVLTEAMALDRSAVAAVSARHVWPGVHPQQQVIGRTVTVADSDLGRISMSQSVSDDGQWWLTVWPGDHSTVRSDVGDLLDVVLDTAAPVQA